MQGSRKRGLRRRSKVWNNYEDVAEVKRANSICRQGSKLNLKKYPKVVDKRHTVD